MISPKLRFSTYLVLTITCAIGCFSLLFLKKTTSRTITSDSASASGPLTAFKKCISLFRTRKMLLLSVACFYSGLELSFYGGVYPTAIAFTSSFEDAKKYVGIYGCLVGSGSIIGGLLFGLSGKRFVKDNRSKVFLLGFIFHIIAYFLIFLNHPNLSTIKPTEGRGYSNFSPK